MTPFEIVLISLALIFTIILLRKREPQTDALDVKPQPPPLIIIRQPLVFGKYHFVEHYPESMKHEQWMVGRIGSGKSLIYTLSRQEALEFMERADLERERGK